MRVYYLKIRHPLKLCLPLGSLGTILKYPSSQAAWATNFKLRRRGEGLLLRLLFFVNECDTKYHIGFNHFQLGKNKPAPWFLFFLATKRLNVPSL